MHIMLRSEGRAQKWFLVLDTPDQRQETLDLRYRRFSQFTRTKNTLYGHKYRKIANFHFPANNLNFWQLGCVNCEKRPIHPRPTLPQKDCKECSIYNAASLQYKCVNKQTR
jgi:hypothetical protein